jgi:formylglycine-generating enzyme required for sulfatase activity
MSAAFQAQVGFLPGPHPNQGNAAVAHRSIGRRACLAGLEGVVLQTPEQRGRCGGAENMVPIYDKGDASSARFCIDVFEFPNQACELPIVWLTPIQAREVCAAQGKRLCDQGEWDLACRADPKGGPDTLYAYGNAQDFQVCNTNKSRLARAPCQLSSLDAMWLTCTTDTEPSGAFPKCRSRFGVYDQHGNVAEIMTRVDWDWHTYDQLKGSAFFYVDVATTPYHWTDRNTYPDHCNFDPRWHMERIETASHFNYHLGFRCCKTIEPEAKDAGGEGG